MDQEQTKMDDLIAAGGIVFADFLVEWAPTMVQADRFHRALRVALDHCKGDDLHAVIRLETSMGYPAIPSILRSMGRPGAVDLFAKLRTSLTSEDLTGTTAELAEALCAHWEAGMMGITVSRPARPPAIDLLLWRGPSAEAAAQSRAAAWVCHRAGLEGPAAFHARQAFVHATHAMKTDSDQASQSFLRFEERISADHGPAELLREKPSVNEEPSTARLRDALEELDVILVAVAVTMSRRG